MRRTYALIVGVGLLAGVACGTSSEDVPQQPDGAGPAARSGSQPTPDGLELIKGPVSADGTQAILATPDLGIGENRIGFVLTSTVGLVRAPAATVSSFRHAGDNSEGILVQTALAVFRPWPYGTRGIYTTRLTFDAPGRWSIEIDAADEGGATRRAQLFFEVEVMEVTSAPAVGSPAIASNNKTIDDVENLSQLTTGSMQDPDLYRMTLAEAAASGLPTVVVMASPAFCTNAVCGPQVEVLRDLKNLYKGQANFIHVDFYDNPEQIQGDLGTARLSPTVVEWALPSTEWTFVIDRKGIVSSRFEAFATMAEIEQSLRRVL